MQKITCGICNTVVCLYQKDGPGNLRRIYIDRISEVKVSISKKELACPKGHVLGVKVMYEKEKRPAFRLFVDATVAEIVKGT